MKYKNKKCGNTIKFHIEKCGNVLKLWAIGDTATFSLLKKCFDMNQGLGDSINRKQLRQFRLYMLVGGMPQAVSAYIETNNFRKVDEIKRDILNLYESDFAKIDPTGRLAMLFDAVPAQLNKNAARYQTSSVLNGEKQDKILELIAELKDSKTVLVAYNTNDANVQFQWKLYDLAEKKWSDITGWTTGNWMSWYPEKAGDYWLYVQARTRTGKIESQVMGYRVGEAEITNFTVNPESPAWTDSTIKLQGNYRDLIRSVASSRFLVYDGHNWSEIAKDVQSADWTPGIIGSYLLCYELDDSNGNAITQTFRGYSIENPYININNINVNQAGSMRYNLSVSSETNDKNAQYKWMYYDIATGQWHDISGWSNSKSITWNAPKEGAFWLHVKAKIHDGTIKDYTIGYTVQKYAADLNAMLAYANLYSSSTPYILMVNRSTHKVGIFQGWRGSWTPIQYWDCGDGAPSTPTVTGVFTVKSRGYYFDSGNARCYWYTQFYGNYLFHSVLYSKYNGSLLDGRVGMALSHGCVRLKIENAKWIYDNIPSGSTVVVY